MTSEVRWLQRFQNFARAVDLLHEPFERGLIAVRDRYLVAIDELRAWLAAKRPA
jgi:hypothetical protein